MCSGKKEYISVKSKLSKGICEQRRLLTVNCKQFHSEFEKHHLSKKFGRYASEMLKLPRVRVNCMLLYWSYRNFTHVNIWHTAHQATTHSNTAKLYLHIWRDEWSPSARQWSCYLTRFFTELFISTPRYNIRYHHGNSSGHSPPFCILSPNLGPQNSMKEECVIHWKSTEVSEEHHLHLWSRWISRPRYEHESRCQAEQPARQNFELYRKQERNGKMELSSHGLVHRIEWNPLAFTQPWSEPI